MQQAMTSEVKPTIRKSDKYIPWYFVGFFLVLFCLDGVFVYLATSSHTGVVEESSYQRGLEYNDRVEAANAQERLGWQSGLVYSADGHLTLTLTTKEGAPIEGAQVTAQFFRPTQAGGDIVLRLTGEGNGNYGAAIKPSAGQWDVRVFAKWKQQHYQVTKKIFIAKK